MFKSLFRLCRIAPIDPTETWEDVTTSQLSIDIPSRSINNLSFDDSIECAQPFGRPDAFLQTAKDYCFLIYGADGFQLQFEVGRLVYVSFFIGPDAHLPQEVRVSFSQPFINSAQLTQAFSRKDIEALLGPPREADCDEEETILYYDQHGLTIEFELSTADSLKMVNIYTKS